MQSGSRLKFCLKDFWWKLVIHFDWSVSMTSWIMTILPRVIFSFSCHHHHYQFIIISTILLSLIISSRLRAWHRTASEDNDRNHESWSVTLMGPLNHAPDRHLIRVRSVVNMQVPVLRSHGSCYRPPAASSAAQFAVLIDSPNRFREHAVENYLVVLCTYALYKVIFVLLCNTHNIP